MNCVDTFIEGLLIFKPQIHTDDRGTFMETFRQNEFENAFNQRSLTVPNLTQENQSHSTHNVLRGLHFQRSHPQGKLIRVSNGSIYDVVVDLRPQSATYGQWMGQTLSHKDGLQLWVPAGFAHGFYVQSQQADVIYKCSDYYQPSDEYTLAWNDPSLAINWPLVAHSQPILSNKDNPLTNPNILSFNTLKTSED